MSQNESCCAITKRKCLFVATLSTDSVVFVTIVYTGNAIFVVTVSTNNAVFVATVSTDSAVFIATLPGSFNFTDTVVAYCQQNPYLWKVSSVAGHLS